MRSVLFLENKLRTDKLGMLYLSRILKDAGHQVDMIQDEIDNADDYLKNHHVDLILYSVTTGGHLWYLERNRDLKRKFKFISVMGGPHFTFYPEQGLSDPDIDFVVQGPGETVILDIVEGRIKDKLVFGHIPLDINSIPSPDRSILYKYDEFGKAGIKRFIAGRDCPHICKYCFNHLYHKLYSKEKNRFFQITNPDKMIQEIKDVQRTYGLKLVYFNDDDLARDHKWIKEFCEKYKKEIKLPFCGSIRADSSNYEILKIMSDAGCSFLNIGLESANLDTIKFLRRGNITPKQVEEANNICKSLGIKVRIQNMIGLPVKDSLKDALETLEFNLKLNPTDSWVAIFQPFPNTDLWKHCLDTGLIDSDTQCMKFYERTVLRIPHAEKINRLKKWWFFIVKYQIPIELVKVLIDLPLTEIQKETLQNLRWDVAKDLLYT